MKLILPPYMVVANLMDHRAFTQPTSSSFFRSGVASSLSQSSLAGLQGSPKRCTLGGFLLHCVCLMFGTSSIFSIALRENLSQPWTYRDDDSSSILARWIATTAMSIMMDLVVTTFSIYLVRGLQMDAKLKSIIVTTFALRLFNTPVAIIRLVSMSEVQADNLSFTYALPETMTQLEMYGNLISATLPCLRILLTAWNTSFMDIRLEEIDNNLYRERE